jgi:hypothetical protein
MFWVNATKRESYNAVAEDISRASGKNSLWTKLLIYRRPNSYHYLVWEMWIISSHTPVFSNISITPFYRDKHPTVLRWYTKYLRSCKYVDMPLLHTTLDITFQTLHSPEVRSCYKQTATCKRFHEAPEERDEFPLPSDTLNARTTPRRLVDFDLKINHSGTRPTLSEATEVAGVLLLSSVIFNCPGNQSLG